VPVVLKSVWKSPLKREKEDKLKVEKTETKGREERKYVHERGR